MRDFIDWIKTDVFDWIKMMGILIAAFLIIGLILQALPSAKSKRSVTKPIMRLRKS